MSNDQDRIDRALELLVFAPLGAGLYLRDMAPTFVNMFVARGRAEIDRRQGEVQQRVTTARSIGEVALAFGVPMVRERVSKKVDDVRRRAEDLVGSAPSAATSAASTPTSAPAPEPTPAPSPSRWVPSVAPEPRPASFTVNNNAPDSATLPIPGYDALSASQVVERLAGLAPGELDAVHAYEAAHRQRRTILGKIEQLAG